jgi:hypothetical protein
MDVLSFTIGYHSPYCSHQLDIMMEDVPGEHPRPKPPNWRQHFNQPAKVVVKEFDISRIHQSTRNKEQRGAWVLYEMPALSEARTGYHSPMLAR